jgi:hypothetical protein
MSRPLAWALGAHASWRRGFDGRKASNLNKNAACPPPPDRAPIGRWCFEGGAASPTIDSRPQSTRIATPWRKARSTERALAAIRKLVSKIHVVTRSATERLNDGCFLAVLVLATFPSREEMSQFCPYSLCRDDV